ncbi:hypothetical protein RhiLY_06090 [Ceratobasidium sp. AG-Ba]|nr:hypothetical protein RhiLY_06090 [Ceratobasidium sp. AG-Ba]
MPICEHCGKEYSQRQISRHRARVRAQENQVFIAILDAMDVDDDPQAHNDEPLDGGNFEFDNHDVAPDNDAPAQNHNEPIAHVDNVFPPVGEPAVHVNPTLDINQALEVNLALNQNLAADDENPVAHDEGMPAPDLGNMEPALDRAGPQWQVVDLEAVIAEVS